MNRIAVAVAAAVGLAALVRWLDRVIEQQDERLAVEADADLNGDPWPPAP